jgi:hypothetical protein
LLLGEAVSVDASGCFLQVRSTDELDITVRLQVPLSAPVAVGCIVEVEGIPEGRRELRGVSLFKFPLAMRLDFDKEMYNEYVTAAHAKVNELKHMDGLERPSRLHCASQLEESTAAAAFPVPGDCSITLSVGL